MACAPTDFGCQAVQSFVNIVTPWILPAIVFVVALALIIGGKWKAKVFGAVVIFVLVWYFVPITGFTLRQVLGLPPSPYFGG